MLELVQRGGPMTWLILLSSLLALIIFLERLLHLHRVQIKAGDFLTGIINILKRQNIVEAISMCDETPGPVARIVRSAILRHDEGKASLLRAVEISGYDEIPRLERNLPLLATLAQLTPLMGLLGTVLGMMQMLVAIEQKTPLVHVGDLAGGLWQALISTAVGLATAILAYAGHSFLIGRVESIVLDMERASGEIIAYFIGTSGPGQEDKARETRG
jgi:biopolymer transport protein ExbB